MPSVKLQYGPTPKDWKKLYEFRRNALSKKDSKRLFDALKPLIPTEKKHLPLFGKPVLEPRLVAFFSADGHDHVYSGANNKSLGWPQPIAELAKIASDITAGQIFDSAICNYYADGNDYISRHRDKDALYGTIVSFSFGGTRTFRIRSNEGEILKDVDLDDGSVFIMWDGFQRGLMHEVKKEEKKHVWPRINVTLRQQTEETKKANIKRKLENYVTVQDGGEKKKARSEPIVG
jgi:alkylated DNA repair dioxygenase AlkB